MDNTIFDLGLSVHATSLYILVDALLQEGEKISLDACEARWSATCEEMHEALEELKARGIVDVVDGHVEIKESETWKQVD